MIGLLPIRMLMPFALPRLPFRSLAMVGIAGPTWLTTDMASANPALTGAVILSALLLFGTFVMARYRLLLLTAPIWLVLMSQAPALTDAPPAAETAQSAATLRPVARPWG